MLVVVVVAIGHGCDGGDDGGHGGGVNCCVGLCKNAGRLGWEELGFSKARDAHHNAQASNELCRDPSYYLARPRVPP